MLDGGATVPFVAATAKEVTGTGLDDTQLRLLEERLGYLRELEERRGVILASIREQGQLSADLETALLAADTRLGWKTFIYLQAQAPHQGADRRRPD